MGHSQSALGVANFNQECARLFANRSMCGQNTYVDVSGVILNFSPAECDSFVTSTNSSVVTLPVEVWGITGQACEDHCGSDRFYQKFIFAPFASSSANWLLPWLALVAQLPFESSSHWTNLEGAFISRGSPALLAYSLTLTVMSQQIIRKRAKQVLDRVNVRSVHPFARQLQTRFLSAVYILLETHQSPMRARNLSGKLSNLIVLEENAVWWDVTAGSLKQTRRGVTASLVAQISLAMITYLFTVIASFIENLGDKKAAEELAAGSLWVWMIPLILSNIIIGTQTSKDTIGAALDNRTTIYSPADLPIPASQATNPPAAGTQAITTNHLQHVRQYSASSLKPSTACLLSQSGTSLSSMASGMLLPLTAAVSRHQADSNDPRGIVTRAGLSDGSLGIPEGPAGFAVNADEETVGPLYNYSRIPAHAQLVNQVLHAFEYTMMKASGKQIWRDEVVQPCSCCSEDDKKVLQYSGLSDLRGFDSLANAYPVTLDHHIKRCYLWAACLAVFVQFGTTGSAIIIAYNTPVVGLGCRSGSYLLYGVSAICAWIFLATSAYLSHLVMLRYQLQQYRGGILRPSTYLAASAVILRLLGKTVAIVNGCWLIISTMLELIGAYDNCFCGTLALVKPIDNRWAIFWKTADDLRDSAGSAWAGGLALTLITCIICTAFFLMAKYTYPLSH